MMRGTDDLYRHLSHRRGLDHRNQLSAGDSMAYRAEAKHFAAKPMGFYRIFFRPGDQAASENDVWR